ncbi:MAG TPA: hypothetical protein VFT65_14385 [Candidatus Angelobacter sp.]|nr:hypothetical protein [Candidatus Angelobacter sp.]
MTITISCSIAMSAQATTDSKATKDAQTNTPSVSLAVDSARKASDLPPAIDTSENIGETWGDYEVKQSAEFGGRISDFTGNQGMWDTFVNLGSGPRLLEYTLDMRSPNHTGKLFDALSFSNFGYGGEPNDVSRLNFSKGKIYTFNSSFRRDQNIFDYDLLANPLNPPTSVPNRPVLDSPHEFLLTRRMSDVTLGLFPVSKVRFKVGWSRVVNEGTSFSSLHNGTDFELLQPTLNTTDSYSIGVSFHVIPKTAINFDQFFTHFKGDTSANIASTPFLLANGVPVDLGLPFNTLANQPCGGATPPLIAGGFANPLCSGLLAYTRQNNIRTNYPTEQLSFQSNYFKRLDFSGRASYSSSDSDNPAFNEFFNGLARNRQRAYTQTGFSNAQRISTSADFGVTYRLTEKLHLVDTFRFENFRIPTGWDYTTTSLFAVNLLTQPNKFLAATCPPPFTAATCPQHVAGSAADVIVDSLNQFLKQDSKINTFEVEYQFTPRVSGYIGYRFESREITQQTGDLQLQTFFPGPTAAMARRGLCAAPFGSLGADGVCNVETVRDPNTGTVIAVAPGTPIPISSDIIPINAHSALFGFSARPTNKIRLSFDTEQYYADNAFTRISPRHLQRYKARATVKPKEWWNLGAAINIRENRNTTGDIGNKQHNRSYAFNSVIAPADSKWGLDVGYDYNDIFSQSNICFVSTPVAVPNNGPQNCGTPFLSAPSFYSETSHVGSGSVYFKPITRVTAAVGYTVTSSNGSTLILNPIAPTGPLAFNYHLPSASLVIQMARNLAFKSGWNYYDYNEKSDPGPTLPRDFRGNTFTLSLRYSM